MAKSATIKELLISQLKETYSMEEQIIEALPKMADEAKSDKLREGLMEHLKVTQKQAERVQQLLEQLDEEANGPKCIGVDGIIKEGEKTLKEVDQDVLDVVIIAAARKVEHYEMANYMNLKELSGLMEDEKITKVIEEILMEEQDTDKKLAELAQQEIYKEAPKG